jgi:hypothetical protein
MNTLKTWYVEMGGSKTLALATLAVATALFAFRPAENNPPPRYKKKVSYDLSTTREHLLPPDAKTADLSDIDLIDMRPEREERHVETWVDENDELVTEITHTLPSTLLEDWMPKVHRTLIDHNGVRQYDANGQLMNTLGQSEQSAEAYQNSRAAAVENLGKLRDWARPTPQMLAELRARGHQVEELKDGRVVKIKKDREETIFDDDGTIEHIQHDAQGRVERSDMQGFRKLGNGKAVPAFTRSSQAKHSYKGVRMMAVEHIVYSNYKVDDREVGGQQPAHPKGGTKARSAANGPTEVQLWPNPVRDVLYLRLPSGTGRATATIIDLDGRSLHTAQGEAGAQIDLPTKALPAGVYLLRIEQADGQRSTQRFVKQQ